MAAKTLLKKCVCRVNSYTSDNQRLRNAGEIGQRSKRSCSNAVLCLSFKEGPNARH